MTWLSILGFLGKAFSAVMDYFRDKKIETAQKNADQLQEAQSDLTEIDTAQKARDAVDARVASDPDSVRGPNDHAAPVGPDGIS